MGQEFFTFTDIPERRCHLPLRCLLQISQTVSIGQCGKQTVIVKVKSELDKFPLQEITTLLNNGCNLKMISCSKNFKHVFLVDVKISSVDGVHYNLKRIR